MARKSAREKLREYFESNLGKVLTTRELKEIGGISEYARRIRELRDDEGMQIRSHIDKHDLKPGEYVLDSLERVPKISSSIPPKLRTHILERNGFACQLCGAGPGDFDPYNPKRKVRLHVDHIVPKSQAGPIDEDNLRVTCSSCNQGRRNISPPSETALNILARIRRLPRKSQREVYDILKQTFNQKKE